MLWRCNNARHSHHPALVLVVVGGVLEFHAISKCQFFLSFFACQIIQESASRGMCAFLGTFLFVEVLKHYFVVLANTASGWFDECLASNDTSSEAGQYTCHHDDGKIYSSCSATSSNSAYIVSWLYMCIVHHET